MPKRVSDDFVPTFLASGQHRSRPSTAQSFRSAPRPWLNNPGCATPGPQGWQPGPEAIAWARDVTIRPSTEWPSTSDGTPTSMPAPAPSAYACPTRNVRLCCSRGRSRRTLRLATAATLPRVRRVRARTATQRLHLHVELARLALLGGPQLLDLSLELLLHFLRDVGGQAPLRFTPNTM